ncbi:colanic acid/amylovoran biosynthesis glycosyltransferase [Salinibacter ruber]|uniref:glycosyltransferase n=1 Tax=Salinibacter ruber TaxID=146919 RepID=UPI002166F088|nr:glycosyltransferase [Salinibacter ruber]MCS3940536.1 colanic acid/amylovoran biosynthesis glycosyltransferase [Salinibacter ruber]
MEVAHFSKVFSPLSQTFVYDSIVELERQGLDNHVITLDRVNAEDRPFDKTHIADKPRWAHPRRLWHRALAQFGIGRFRKDEKNWTSWPILRSRIEKILRGLRPDIIHAQFGPAGVIVAPVARALSVPLVVTFHGYDATMLAQEARWQRAYRRLFEQVVMLLGVSTHICERLSALGAPSHKIKRFHLGVQVDEFSYQGASAPVNQDTVHCLHVGRLVEKKAPVLLVEAFHHAQELFEVDGSELSLTIAGDGPLLSDVERRIRELDMKESVELLGAVPHEQVVDLMHASDIYTQHSITAANGDQEGLPIGLMEAAATGLPIVTTRHSGIPDLVSHGETGLLVEEQDVQEMGRCIAELAAAPEHRHSMGRAGRQRVVDRFNLEKQMRKLIGFYENALSPKMEKQ